MAAAHLHLRDVRAYIYLLFRAEPTALQIFKLSKPASIQIEHNHVCVCVLMCVILQFHFEQ